jgi:uncharacterized membrane protein
MNVTTVQRLGGLDRLRGLAVGLMVADHVLLAAGAGVGWRLGPTRVALPLFCLVAGALGGGPWERRSRRVAQLGVAGVVVSCTAGLVLGTGAPDVLLVLALGIVVVELVERAGSPLLTLAVLAVAAVQPVTWRVGTGYQVGTVVVLLWLGGLPGVREGLDAAGSRLPVWLERAGRRPLTVYVVHLTVLAGGVVLMRGAG